MRYNDNKAKYIRYVIYIALIVAAALLQNSNGALPEIFGARAFLSVPLSVCIAMHEREIPAAIFGGVAGAFWDACSGNDGFSTLVLMLISAVCSVLISHLMRRNIITALVLCSGGVVAYELLYILINIIISGAGNPLGVMITFYLPSMVYTLLFIPIIYYSVSKVSSYFENSYTVFSR